MKKRKPVFRLVRNKDGKRVSLFVSSEPYVKTYTKGSTVKAAKHSIGIFCFRTKKEAERYKRTNWVARAISNAEIIKVLPIGRGIMPKRIAVYFAKISIDAFTNRLKQGKPSPTEIGTMVPAKGVICYPAVKVLT